MAFTNINMQIDDVLDSDFIPDAYTKLNTNFVEVQSTIEDLINNLQIDVANKTIGTTLPVSYIRIK